MLPTPSERDRTITRILGEVAGGDRDAVAALLPEVYDELRQLASGFFRDQRPGHTLQPTALVHEAFVRITGRATVASGTRGEFFALAATVMRHILVDHARGRTAAKRGGGADGDGWERVTLAGVVDDSAVDARSRVDVLALEEVLERLAALEPDDARLVELRFHGGLTNEETAEALGISRAAVARRWRRVRAWLAEELAEHDPPADGDAQ